MSKVDRYKTKKINDLIINGIEEIKGNENNERLLKFLMSKFGILGGEVRKIMLEQELDSVKLSVKYMLLESIYEILGSEKYNLEPFYNGVKLKFLHRYPNSTQTPYARIFEKSKKYEEEYKKDLSEFSLSELENVLHELEPLTISSSNVNTRIITAYIDWCIDNDVTNVKNNELKDKTTDFFKRFVDEDLELYFSEDTIEKITLDCINPQDAVLIKLLFEGVQGKSLSEIRNIKKEHVRQAIENNNVLVVYDEDNNKRKIELEQSTIDLLEEAMNQTVYEKKNGKMEDESVGLLTNLVSNDYVIRSSITRTSEANKPADKMVIYRRIKTIGDIMGIPHLTAKNIVRSGIIYEGSKKISNGDLNKDDYLGICAKYNIEKWHPVKKYCNPQIINKLYKEKKYV